MNKTGAMFSGCLTGMIGLVLIVASWSFIEGYLYDAPFRYQVGQNVPNPSGNTHAHYFIKNSMQDSRGKYAGVSLSPTRTLSRGNENEVFVVSPCDALVALDLIWIDDRTLEIRYQIDPSAKAYIHYGRAPANLIQRLSFTEIPRPRTGDNS